MSVILTAGSKRLHELLRTDTRQCSLQQGMPIKPWTLSPQFLVQRASSGRARSHQQIVSHGHGEDRICVGGHFCNDIFKRSTGFRLIIDHLLVERRPPGGFVGPFGIANEPSIGIAVQP
ncbi:hypothetical protein FHS49_003858 [Sphingobium boeckii]|uniref:Uncharacterized protein n=1 Tax=Sphingobium boeckii TaxID=1082345 RepID=A0A7W9EG03_9SPHN|nr:hypothetical protein [Sphingobium boeckii]